MADLDILNATDEELAAYLVDRATNKENAQVVAPGMSRKGGEFIRANRAALIAGQVTPEDFAKALAFEARVAAANALGAKAYFAQQQLTDATGVDQQGNVVPDNGAYRGLLAKIKESPSLVARRAEPQLAAAAPAPLNGQAATASVPATPAPVAGTSAPAPVTPAPAPAAAVIPAPAVVATPAPPSPLATSTAAPAAAPAPVPAPPVPVPSSGGLIRSPEAVAAAAAPAAAASSGGFDLSEMLGNLWKMLSEGAGTLAEGAGSVLDAVMKFVLRALGTLMSFVMNGFKGNLIDHWNAGAPTPSDAAPAPSVPGRQQAAAPVVNTRDAQAAARRVDVASVSGGVDVDGDRTPPAVRTGGRQSPQAAALN